jgi:hypothetical protein
MLVILAIMVGAAPRSGRSRAHTPIARERAADPAWRRQEATSVGFRNKRRRS